MRDPRIALTVNDGEDGYRWVGLTGTVRATTDQSTAQADIAEMARRYHADDPDKAERLIRDRFRASSASRSGSDRPPSTMSSRSDVVPMTRFGLQLWSQQTDWPGFRDSALAAEAAGLGLDLDVGPPDGHLRAVGAADLRGLERPGRARRRDVAGPARA